MFYRDSRGAFREQSGRQSLDQEARGKMGFNENAFEKERPTQKVVQNHKHVVELTNKSLYEKKRDYTLVLWVII